MDGGSDGGWVMALNLVHYFFRGVVVVVVVDAFQCKCVISRTETW